MPSGSIETRSNRKGQPTYRARIDVGRDPILGKRRFETKTFRTKKAAERWLREIGNKLDNGTFIQFCDEPLGRYLTHWLATRHDLAWRTHRQYEKEIRLRIAPALGSIPLGSLSGNQIQSLYNQWAGRSYPPLQHTILRQALNQAIAEGLIARNPALNLRPIGLGRRTEQQVWNAEQLRTFLRAAESSRLHPLFVTLAATGMRIGETLALSWRDISLDARTLTVSNEAKTAKSRRTITLDEDTVSCLKDHKRHQREHLLQLSILVTDGTPVFDRGDGERLNRSTVWKAMKRLQDQTGLPPLTIHGLRHGHASALIQAGLPINYVSRRLGHASADITLRIYAHVIPNTEFMAPDLYQAFLRGTTQDKNVAS